MTAQSLISALGKRGLELTRVLTRGLLAGVWIGIFCIVFALCGTLAERSYSGGIPGYMTILWGMGAGVATLAIAATLANTFSQSLRLAINQWLEKDGWPLIVSGLILYGFLLLIGYIAGQSLPGACAFDWSWGCFSQWVYLFLALLMSFAIVRFWVFAIRMGPALQRYEEYCREMRDDL